MAFKKLKDYNEERYGHMFLLRNDGDYADVIFLYQSEDDVLVADTHYIKSSEYSGYVHCCGKHCPACAKGIRVQTKLFIPLYNINAQEIQFWDRNSRFENQLESDVLSKFPNPSDVVFRITRHGATGDVNTTYQITPFGKNSTISYDDILAKFEVSLPDHYSCICREYSSSELEDLINMQEDTDYDSIPDYSVSPRNFSSAINTPESSHLDGFSDIPDIPDEDISEELLDGSTDISSSEDEDTVDF